MATISTVRQRLKDILDEFITTLPDEYAESATAYRYIPRSLDAAELPAFVILPTDGRTRRPQADSEETSRVYAVRMYVAPLSQGIENELEEYAESWVDDVRLFLNKKPRLEDVNNDPLNDIVSALSETDGGMVAANYPIGVDGSPVYLMIEWRVTVVSRKWGIT